MTVEHKLPLQKQAEFVMWHHPWHRSHSCCQVQARWSN